MDTGGKPSTWLPPERLVELYIHFESDCRQTCLKIRMFERKIHIFHHFYENVLSLFDVKVLIIFYDIQLGRS